MNRLVVCCYLLIGWVAPLTSCNTPTAAAQQPSPNVILFLVDDLGWSDVGCYGSQFYETPHIDRLAKRSVRFTQAYAACHVCSPTRASIVTGKYPARLQLTDWLPGRKEFPFQQLSNATTVQQLPLAEVTLAEALRDHGYRTAHIGKWHLGEEPFGPRQQGFDLQIPRWNKGWPKAGYHPPFEMDNLDSQPGDYLTDRLTDAALEFIDSSGKQPFFLYLAHFAVHDPIEGRADLVAKYQRKLEGLPPAEGAAFVLEGNPDDQPPVSQIELQQRLGDEAWSGYRVLPDRLVKIKQHQDNVQFAAMVEAVDESLGRLVSKLESLQLANDTVIILCSDNGGMSAANFGNPSRVINAAAIDKAFSTANLPLRGGKGWLYEGGIRVPFIVHWPVRGRVGQVCNTPVVSSDIYPTVLDMLGLPLRPLQHVDGVSLAPLLSGSGDLERAAIYWHFPHYSNHGLQSPGGAIRAGDYKLLEYFENGTVQLFNLRTDPGELHDLSKAEPTKAAELRSMLQTWRNTLSAQRMVANPDYVPAAGHDRQAAGR